MIIFSVERTELTGQENYNNASKAMTRLAASGAHTEVMTGVYQGQMESSFMSDNVELGRQLAKEYNQECYLERGHKGVWYLVDTESNKVIDWFSGIFEVPKEEAEDSGNYSMFNNKYYIAK